METNMIRYIPTMPTPPKVAIKRYRRFTGWDYSRGASLFITIATAPRHAHFGHIKEGKVELSALGKIVQESLELIPRLNPGIRLFGHVVMPDHIHLNVHIDAGLAEPLRALGKAISRFKNYTTKQAKLLGLIGHSPIINMPATQGCATAQTLKAHADRCAVPQAAEASGDGRAGPQAAEASGDGRAVPQAAEASGDGRAVPVLLWQQGYHDRLCLTREFIESTERYIAYNPLKWELMYGTHADGLRIHEPLDVPCLDAADYWKGVGNVALLQGKIVSLRVSREVRAPHQIATVVARMKNAAEKGYTILSGFISPGEKAVRDMLCANPGARFIRILPSCIPNARFKPESRYVRAFAEGRYLEIAKGNDEVAFDRTVCLDYNAEITRIANAGDSGLALYWKGDGAHRLPTK